MITSDLIRVRIKQANIEPSFVDPESPRMLERAGELVEIWSAGLQRGATRGELSEEVEDLIGDGIDHKLVRGLAKVLDDCCVYASEPPIAPEELRRRLFEAVGAAPSREAAAAAYAQLSAELNLPVDALKRLLFSDRKAEQQIQAIDAGDGAWLLNRYNVSLVQAMLLHCESLRVWLREPAPERLRQLFRAVKFHGLMYRIAPTNDGQELSLDGPVSLLRHSTRYGMALATWFPALLLQTCAWTLEAELRWTNRRLRKTMRLDSSLGLRSHHRDVGAYITRTEQWFIERFEALNSGWTLGRDAVVLDLGGQAVVCPEFTFRKDGRVAYLEIVGFWRKQWLKSRLDLLRKIGPPNLVLAVSSRLEAEKAEMAKFPGVVVPFKEVVPSKDVLAAIEQVALPEPPAGAPVGVRA